MPAVSRLARVEPGVIGLDVQPVGMTPRRRQLDAVTLAPPVRIRGAGQEGHRIEGVDDLVPQAVGEAGDADGETRVRPADPGLPAARASRASGPDCRRRSRGRSRTDRRRSAGRCPRHKPRAGLTPPPGRTSSETRTVVSSAKALKSSCRTARSVTIAGAPFRPPLADEGGEAARPILVGAAEELDVSRARKSSSL